MEGVIFVISIYKLALIIFYIKMEETKNEKVY